MVRIALYAAALLYALSVVVSAGMLPAEVPLHFGPDGFADRYGSRSEAVIGFVVLGIFMLGLWLVVLRCVRRAGLGLINVPHADYWKTPEHEPELRRRLQVDLTGFVAATFLLLAIPASTAVAAGASGQLPDVFDVAFALYLGGTLAWCAHLSTRRYRPPAERASR